MVEDVVGKLGGSGVNDNYAGPFIELCLERDFVIDNTSLKEKKKNK